MLKVWRPKNLRSPGRLVLVVLFVILVATLCSSVVLYQLSRGPTRFDLCDPSGRLPGRLREYICSGNIPNLNAMSSPKGHLFGVASSVHVVHLARRKDRLETMERLRRFLGFEWVYEEALEKTEPVTGAILDYVRRQRAEQVQFEWPSLNETTLSWTNEGLFAALNESVPSSRNLTDALLCASGDNEIPAFRNTSKIPFQMILSRGMIACWYSHLQVLRKVVRISALDISGDWDGKDGVAVIFEDDIDVEIDITWRLEDMWSDLPLDWDMLFLGHCWSDESIKPPISPSSPIHPSTGPKCTHAYALSPKGARRLLLHLTYPPFAFSRALDQAFAHLIRSGRINAFSVVPSIVIQRRERNDSDIWATVKGSGWKEMLKHSAFDEIGNGRDVATRL